MIFTDDEIATVLAALRYWQQNLVYYGKPPIDEHFVNVKPLTVAQIDNLCERINWPPLPAERIGR